jgi:hypothetical protein
MRKLSVLCAAAGFIATALVAASPAQASFALIRWQDTGYCQIWDTSVPTQPFSMNYTTVAAALPTFSDALATKDGLLRTGTCNL